MNANHSGHVTEEAIAAILRGCKIVFDQQRIVGRTIYGTDYRVDFVLLNIRHYPQGLILESKWQDTGGSVDEKFPYLVGNIRQAPMPGIVVVHGGGHRPEAIEWLRNHCDGKQLIGVFQLEEFVSWALRTDRTPLPALV